MPTLFGGLEAFGLATGGRIPFGACALGGPIVGPGFICAFCGGEFVGGLVTKVLGLT